MSKTQPTPGPWKYHLGRGKNPRFHIQTTAGYQIASTPEVSQNGDEAKAQEANAAAIAALPETREALAVALEALRSVAPLECVADSEGDTGCDHCTCAAAIAKAEKALGEA